MDNRITKALNIALKSAGVDGAHHKQWVIDQMIRALTDCPTVNDTALNCRGEKYTFERQGESEAYRQWVVGFESGEDGPKSYEWDMGVAP